MRILSVDPGLANIGWAVMSSKRRIVAYGMITTPAGMQLAKRLKMIRAKLRMRISRYKCTMMVMEEFSSFMGMQNKKTAMDITKAHGAIQTLPLPVALVHANQVVKRQKKRNREKRKLHILKLVRKTYGLKLKESYNHVADAIWQGRYFYEAQRKASLTGSTR